MSSLSCFLAGDTVDIFGTAVKPIIQFYSTASTVQGQQWFIAIVRSGLVYKIKYNIRIQNKFSIKCFETKRNAVIWHVELFLIA